MQYFKKLERINDDGHSFFSRFNDLPLPTSVDFGSCLWYTDSGALYPNLEFCFSSSGISAIVSDIVYVIWRLLEMGMLSLTLLEK